MALSGGKSHATLRRELFRLVRAQWWPLTLERGTCLPCLLTMKALGSELLENRAVSHTQTYSQLKNHRKAPQKEKDKDKGQRTGGWVMMGLGRPGLAPCGPHPASRTLRDQLSTQSFSNLEIAQWSTVPFGFFLGRREQGVQDSLQSESLECRRNSPPPALELSLY